MKKVIGIIAACTMVAAFAMPAAATDWNFYGSARMATFWDARDFGDDVATGKQEDDFDATWDLQGNARLGATVDHGALGGGFEYGSGPNLRKLYGTFTTGDMQLLIGQTYTPAGSYFYSNQVYGADTDLLNCGQAYNGRRPMIQVKVGGFKIALVKPHAISDLEAGSYKGSNQYVETSSGNYEEVLVYNKTKGLYEPLKGDYVAADTDLIVPKLELSYGFASDTFFFDVFGGIQSYEIDRDVKGDGDDENITVTSTVGGFGFGFTPGAIFVKAGAYAGLNTGQYGLWQLGDADAAINAKGDDIDDNMTIGGLFVFGANVSETATVETGVGFISHDLDTDADTDEDQAMTFYVNCTVKFLDNFFIVPEVGYIDYMDDMAGNDEGTNVYAGAKWQINF